MAKEVEKGFGEMIGDALRGKKVAVFKYVINIKATKRVKARTNEVVTPYRMPVGGKDVESFTVEELVGEIEKFDYTIYPYEGETYEIMVRVNGLLLPFTFYSMSDKLILLEE